MATYYLKEDFQGGYGDSQSRIELAPQVYFKKGDKVIGLPIPMIFGSTRGVENNNRIQGILVSSSKNPLPIFIPLEKLSQEEIIIAPNNDPLSVNTQKLTAGLTNLSTDNTKLLQYAVIGLILYVVFIK